MLVIAVADAAPAPGPAPVAAADAAWSYRTHTCATNNSCRFFFAVAFYWNQWKLKEIENSAIFFKWKFMELQLLALKNGNAMKEKVSEFFSPTAINSISAVGKFI